MLGARRARHPSKTAARLRQLPARHGRVRLSREMATNDEPPVLIADDDRDVRTMLRTLFELDGHEVIEAKDGDEAWKCCVDYQPAVVVADVQMPGIDGLQLCRKIRESRYSPEMKVIVYTAGMGTPQEARRAVCEGDFVAPEHFPQL